MRAFFLFSIFGVAAGCHLPPPTTVTVTDVNSDEAAKTPPLVPDATYVEASAIEGGAKPVCSVVNGKEVNDEARLAKVLAAVTEWQKTGKKAPPKPVDPNAGPVTVDKKGVGVRIPGMGKHRTDHDPEWLAVACTGGKITITLENDVYEMDALYMIDEKPPQQHLVLGGYSLKNKHVFNAHFPSKPPAGNVWHPSSFPVFDVTSYLTSAVESVTAVEHYPSYNFYFVEPGRKSGVVMYGPGTGGAAGIGRFTVGTAPAAK